MLPSAREIPYAAAPARIDDPAKTLRELALRVCPAGASIEVMPGALRVTDSCNSPNVIRIAGLSRVEIVAGDWLQLRLFFTDGDEDGENYSLRFSLEHEEDALLAADALWALELSQRCRQPTVASSENALGLRPCTLPLAAYAANHSDKP